MKGQSIRRGQGRRKGICPFAGPNRSCECSISPHQSQLASLHMATTHPTQNGSRHHHPSQSAAPAVPTSVSERKRRRDDTANGQVDAGDGHKRQHRPDSEKEEERRRRKRKKQKEKRRKEEERKRSGTDSLVEDNDVAELLEPVGVFGDGSRYSAFSRPRRRLGLSLLGQRAGSASSVRQSFHLLCDNSLPPKHLSRRSRRRKRGVARMESFVPEETW